MWRRKSSGGEQELEAALARVLRLRRSNNLFSSKVDPRERVEQVCRQLNLDPSLLLPQLAKVLEVPFCPRVQPIELESLPTGWSLSVLREVGAIPIGLEGMIYGLVCANPTLAHPTAKKLGVQQLFLSRWPAIAQALDQSEQQFQERCERRGQVRQRALKQAARQVIAYAISEARSHGQNHLAIIRYGERLQYSFRIGEDSQAKGAILAEITEYVWQILLARSQVVVDPTTLAESGQLFQVKQIDDGFELEWGEHSDRDVTEVQELGTSKKKSKSSSRSSGKSKQPVVLIVEDNLTFSFVLERFLTRQDLRVERASDGQEALELVSSGRSKPQLMIVDLHLPSLSGFELVRLLRRQTNTRQIPIIMLTAEEDISTQVRLIEAGVNVYLSKSQDPQLLCAHVRQILGLTRVAEEELVAA